MTKSLLKNTSMRRFFQPLTKGAIQNQSKSLKKTTPNQVINIIKEDGKKRKKINALPYYM